MPGPAHWAAGVRLRMRLALVAALAVATLPSWLGRTDTALLAGSAALFFGFGGLAAGLRARHRLSFGLLSQPLDDVPMDLDSEELQRWREAPFQRFVWRSGQVGFAAFMLFAAAAVTVAGAALMRGW